MIHLLTQPFVAKVPTVHNPSPAHRSFQEEMLVVENTSMGPEHSPYCLGMSGPRG